MKRWLRMAAAGAALLMGRRGVDRLLGRFRAKRRRRWRKNGAENFLF